MHRALYWSWEKIFENHYKNGIFLVVYLRNGNNSVSKNAVRGKMTKHHEHTGNAHKHPEHAHQHSGRLTRPKPKWWQWLALALMLLAIGTYVLTLDDSTVPVQTEAR